MDSIFLEACGASGALYTLIYCLIGCQCMYSCFYRSKMRAQYVLHESPCNDCLVHCCCETCALCQEYRELERRGFDMHIGMYTSWIFRIFFLSIFRFWVICWVVRALRFCRMACEHGEAGEDGAARGGAADGPRIHESLEMGELLVIYSVILCCYYCHQFNLYCVLMISVLLILKLHVTVLPIYNATCWHFWVLGWI